MKIGGFKLILTICYLLAFLVSACTSARPKKIDIVGIWQERQGVLCNNVDIPCASFEFFADGHFTASHVPVEYFLGPIGYSWDGYRTDISGTWYIDNIFGDRITLETAAGNTEIFVRYRGKKLFLYAWLEGEADLVFAPSP